MAVLSVANQRGVGRGETEFRVKARRLEVDSVGCALAFQVVVGSRFFNAHCAPCSTTARLPDMQKASAALRIKLCVFLSISAQLEKTMGIVKLNRVS